MTCPLLKSGTHYTTTARWPVVMTAAVGCPLPIQAAPLDFHSGEIHLARWDGRFFSILPGYACDGYSPVIRAFGRWLRLTPAPACGLWPAVLHDALRQFLPVSGCPWTRRDTDNWFFDALTAGGVSRPIAGAYHAAVAGPLGTAWINLTRSPDSALRVTPADTSRTLRQQSA